MAKIEDESAVKEIISKAGYTIRHTRKETAKPENAHPFTELDLSEKSREFLKKRDIDSLWNHQLSAIDKALNGKNICITTSTSSGKTEIFQIAAMELLQKNPDAKILAVYPMKALNAQQIDRWKKTGYPTGKIDGNVDSDRRPEILNNNRIVVMTPDVIQAYLLGNFNSEKSNIRSAIQNFIKNIALVVIDELHVYKGIFGSNSAYLFRRLNNLHRLLTNYRGKRIPQYITASATLPNAPQHSSDISGAKDFIEISKAEDGSPSSEKVYYFIEPDTSRTDGDVSLTDLVYGLTEIEDSKSITFVDSRQKTGQITAEIEERLEDVDIYPYKSRLEKTVADEITRRMSEGRFRGLISTSALEMGLDIDGLNIAIIADMPQDKNSYQQRIGRVGRFGCKKSYVIIVRNDRNVASELLFNDPAFDIDKVLPSYEPALYLGDKLIQSVHALCHVGDTGSMEYAQWRGKDTDDKGFNHGDCFPKSFVDLCQLVLTGSPGAVYDGLIRTGWMGAPQFAFSLRTFGRQFKLRPAIGATGIPEDVMISRREIATEGYNRAIRFDYDGTHTIKERITGRDAESVYAKRYHDDGPVKKTTSYRNTYIIPNFNKELRNNTLKYGNETFVFNLPVKENIIIHGYYEQFEGYRIYHQYPTADKLPQLITTGTLIFHPSFNNAGVKMSDIAKLMFVAFLQRNAFDRNDINYIGGRIFFTSNLFSRGDKYVAFYDENESFNITGRIADDKILQDLFNYIKVNIDILISSVVPDMSTASRDAILALCDSIIGTTPVVSDIEVGKERFIRPGSEVIYKYIDAEEKEHEDTCIFTGYTSDNSECSILLDGKFITPVAIAEIYPTANTIYE